MAPTYNQNMYNQQRYPAGQAEICVYTERLVEQLLAKGEFDSGYVILNILGLMQHRLAQELAKVCREMVATQISVFVEQIIEEFWNHFEYKIQDGHSTIVKSS